MIDLNKITCWRHLTDGRWAAESAGCGYVTVELFTKWHQLDISKAINSGEKAKLIIFFDL